MRCTELHTFCSDFKEPSAALRNKTYTFEMRQNEASQPHSLRAGRPHPQGVSLAMAGASLPLALCAWLVGAASFPLSPGDRPCSPSLPATPPPNLH